MRRLAVLVAIGFVLATGPAAFGQILYDNQSSLPGALTLGLVTNPGGGFNGGDLSALTAPSSTFGFTANTGTAFRIADNFTVPAGQVWTVNGANIYGYTTGAVATTFTGVSLRFWDGVPGVGNIIAGDTTTNFQTAAEFFGPTPIFRALSTAPLTNNRQVQQSTGTLPVALVLNPGTYWIDFAITSSTGAVFTPPMTLPGAPAVTGDALQFNGTAWVAMIDAGDTFAKGAPFRLIGTAIPEPTSLALVGVGVAGLAWRRLRKKS